MTRIAALIAGLLLTGLLLICPVLWLIEGLGKGPSEEFVFLGWALVAIHGSVLVGIAVSWARANRIGQPFRPSQVLEAGMFGVLAGCFVSYVGGSIYAIVKYGSFDSAVGAGLWLVLAISWVVLGGLVSAGSALLFYAWRGAAGPTGAGPGT